MSTTTMPLDAGPPLVVGDPAAGFWRAIECEPGDWTAYLVFADWLDEHRRPELAHAMRWMGTRQKRPHHRDCYRDRAGAKIRAVPGQYAWAWYSSWFDVYPGNPVPDHARLPLLVFTGIGRHSPHYFGRTFRDCVNRLVHALLMLRDCYSVEPEPLPLGTSEVA